MVVTRAGTSAGIFLSYTRADRQAALRVVGGLQSRDVSVWWDQACLRAGHSWPPELEQALNHCDGYVIPAVRRGWLADATASLWWERWYVLQMRPGEHPLEELAVALSKKLPASAASASSAAEIKRALESGDASAPRLRSPASSTSPGSRRDERLRQRSERAAWQELRALDSRNAPPSASASSVACQSLGLSVLLRCETVATVHV